jgi:hypothetical protein
MGLHLSEKTVLANFSCSRWGGHRCDKAVSDEIHAMKNAAADTGSYNKRLLPKGATTKIDAAVGAARDFHRSQTMCWLDNGVRILPAVNYMTYAKRMGEHKAAFWEEVEDLLKAYPEHKATAKKRHGKLYVESDYPSVTELREWYKWELTILPFPDSQDFRAEVPDLKSIQKDLDERIKELYATAVADVGERVVDVVGRMSERLKAFKPGQPGKRAEGTFKDSLVENVRELADLLPSFNLTNDKKLAGIIAKMKSDLCKHDADLLRDDDRARAKVAASADAVLTAIADYIA